MLTTHQTSPVKHRNAGVENFWLHRFGTRSRVNELVVNVSNAQAELGEAVVNEQI